jgi:hypothetical protein
VGYSPGVEQMRQVISLFAHNRELITDELIEMRYRKSQPASPRFMAGDVSRAAAAVGG